LRGSLALAFAGLGIRQAFLLRLFDRRRGDQDALALIVVARPRPFDNYGAQWGMLCRPTGQRRVAARKKFEMVEIGTLEAKGPVILHANHASFEEVGAAFGALAVVAGEKDNDVAGFPMLYRWDIGRRRDLRFERREFRAHRWQSNADNRARLQFWGL